MLKGSNVLWMVEILQVMSALGLKARCNRFVGDAWLITVARGKTIVSFTLTPDPEESYTAFTVSGETWAVRLREFAPGAALKEAFS